MNINKITITIVLSILTIISCNKAETKEIKSENTVEKDTFSATNQEELALENSTKEEGTIIHPFEVVHVSATEKQIDSLTQGLDEEDYSIVTDDAYYYTAQAQKYLDSMKIKTINVDAGKKVIFVSKTGKKYPYKTKVAVSEFILFNGETAPEVADMVSIDKHIEKLYKRAK